MRYNTPNICKALLALILLFSGSSAILAKPVSEASASLVARNFLSGRMHIQSKQDISPKLVYTAASSVSASSPATATSYFYIFGAGNGFVIVSADDNVRPVLGYSTEGGFDPGKISPDVNYWLENYKLQIAEVIDKHVQATQSTSSEWTALLSGPSSSSSLGKTNGSVSPMLRTTWDQSGYYNELCPFDYAYGKHAVTGCVATAMAQLMRFWKYPSSGTGTHSYNSAYGILNADFENTTYDWPSMPISVSSSNPAVATLMYHCGVSLDMSYSVQSSGSYLVSSASPVTNCAEYALKTYFGYKETLSGLQRIEYTDEEWLSLLEKELNAGRPVMYAGFGSGGGHCFIFDGYDADDFMHINWGWSGMYNGYFLIDKLNPLGVGTGGGTGGFNSSQQALIGIEPSPDFVNGYKLAINDSIFSSVKTVLYGQPFTISSNVINKGSTDFKGDYAVAIFDRYNDMVLFADSIQGSSLLSGKTYNKDLVFKNNGSYILLPGNYTVRMYYRAKGGSWMTMPDNSNLRNSGSLTVVNTNSIEMYSDMKILNTGTLIAGDPLAVNLNIINNGADFSGTVGLALYNPDGTTAATVQEIADISLASGASFSNDLHFSTSHLKILPGTYLLVALVKPDNGNWQIVGATHYQNPVKVMIGNPALQPDMYEPDNTAATAYNLEVTYNGNTGYVSTTGANCNVSSDWDFYKIKLDSAYNYTISANLKDQNTPSVTDYNLDGNFSYSVNDSTWPAINNDTLTNTVADSSGYVYFQVSSKTAGRVGTYLLEINITRIPKAGIADFTGVGSILVYPNPVKENLNINLLGIKSTPARINIINAEGQVVYTENNLTIRDRLQIPTSGLADGVYVLQMQAGNEVLTRKIVLQR